MQKPKWPFACGSYAQQTDGSRLSSGKEPYPDTRLQSVQLSPERSLRVYAPGHHLTWSSSLQPAGKSGHPGSPPERPILFQEQKGEFAIPEVWGQGPGHSLFSSTQWEQRAKLHSRAGAHSPAVPQLRNGPGESDIPPRQRRSDRKDG